jgi:small subunit ribosomal protein S16
VVRIRMSRHGRPHRPFFRIAAVDSRVKRDGAVIEELGYYDPMVLDSSKQLQLNHERVKYWLSVGAQPSETVADMLARLNLIDAAARRQRHERRVAAAKAAAEKAAAAGEKGEKKDEAKAAS